MNMKKYWKWIFIGVLAILLLCNLICLFHLARHNLDKDLNKLNLDKVDSLMIVAHPDDETLWGGAHLNEDNYLVVCITCGKNRWRYHEIKAVTKMSNNSFVGLYYPDKTLFTINNWHRSYDSIQKDVEKIVKMKKWKQIVTHNKQGEYGHIHHKKTHKIVTDVYENLKLQDKVKLYYFGDYYSNKKIKLLTKDDYLMSDVDFLKKEKMIKKYKSQYFVTKKFKHMNRHENFQEYNEETR